MEYLGDTFIVDRPTTNRVDIMAEDTTPVDCSLFQYKGFNLISNLHHISYLDTLENFETRDSDVFAVTYPKSGTIWMQHILGLMHYSNDLEGPESKLTVCVVPWLEVQLPIRKDQDPVTLPSPRLHVTHLPQYLMPKGLRKKKGKVIYVARNPKDIAVSFYHFHHYCLNLETPTSFDHFLEKFLHGQVFGGSWFDHIKEWYKHKEEFDFLHLTYEEMVKDLRAAVVKIANFLGKQIDDRTIETIVDKCTFKNMRCNPSANYQMVPKGILDHNKGIFMRKGKVGDWKTHFTVAQNERFDEVYQEKMKDVPLDFIWDIND
ncbi:amine sulfotransferase-like isoform X1 [Polyodon spathula]|nr:amine sulfotransferase-like isoform X1 [Polyodon spathula]